MPWAVKNCLNLLRFSVILSHLVTLIYGVQQIQTPKDVFICLHIANGRCDYRKNEDIVLLITNLWTEITVIKKWWWICNSFSQHLQYFSHIIEMAGVAVTFYIPIRKVFRLNIGRDTCYPFLDCRSFPQSLQAIPRIVPWFGHDHFVPNPFQVSYHSTLNGLTIHNVVKWPTENVSHIATDTLKYIRHGIIN